MDERNPEKMLLNQAEIAGASYVLFHHTVLNGSSKFVMCKIMQQVTSKKVFGCAQTVPNSTYDGGDCRICNIPLLYPEIAKGIVIKEYIQGGQK